MKPNFEQISTPDLKAYVLEHREDIEPLRILFSRRSPDLEAKGFPLPKTEEEWQQQLEAIKPILQRDREKERENQRKTDFQS